MKKIYIVTISDKFGTDMAYYTNKKEAEKFVKENDKPWTNMNGIVIHTATMREVETKKFFTAKKFY